MTVRILHLRLDSILELSRTFPIGTKEVMAEKRFEIPISHIQVYVKHGLKTATLLLL